MRRLVLAAAMACLAAPSIAAPQASDLQAAQIQANVPAPGDFNAFLKRDLTAFFVGRGLRNPDVTTSLLRDGPTQSGVSWPKYYVWVSVSSDGAPPVSGAVRVAAVDRVQFEVTDFVSREDIVADPDAAASVFPTALLPLIQQRAAGN